MKSDYRIRAQKFIQQFFPFIEDIISDSDRRWHVNEYDYAVKKFNAAKHRKVDCQNGAVRVVFITSDYVVKFDYDLDEAENYGGCENEYKAFQYAKHDGFGYLFAEITRYTISGFDFYIMPRVHICADMWKSIDDYIDDEEYDYLNTNVADLHEYNWGFLNGRIKIIDYACSFDLR